MDLRRSGSGNIGATNVARTVGIGYGVFTLLLDLGKGLVPVLVAKYLFDRMEPPALAGLAAFLGHLYSPFLKFRGGKGVATALGVFLGLTPWAVLPSLIVFVGITARWRYVSAGSLGGAVACPISAALMNYPAFLCLMTLVVTAFIFLRHRQNIGRLWRGEENRFGKSRRS